MHGFSSASDICCIADNLSSPSLFTIERYEQKVNKKVEQKAKGRNMY
jgi:hypothetical protein